MLPEKQVDNRINHESFRFLKLPLLPPVTVFVVAGLPDVVVVPVKSKHQLSTVAFQLQSNEYKISFIVSYSFLYISNKALEL